MELGERRSEPRHVIEGLNVVLDGREVEVLDMSACTLRLWWPEEHGAPPATATLHLRSEAGRPALDARPPARLIRHTRGHAVYAYPAPVANWPRFLLSFDAFTDTNAAARHG